MKLGEGYTEPPCIFFLQLAVNLQLFQNKKLTNVLAILCMNFIASLVLMLFLPKESRTRNTRSLVTELHRSEIRIGATSET